MLTPKDLTADERRQLNGCAQKAVQEGMSTELVSKEVRDLLNSRLRQRDGKTSLAVAELHEPA